MKNFFISLLFFIMLTIAFFACSILSNAKRLSQCSFILSRIENIKIASVKIDNINNINQIDNVDMLKIIASLANKSIDLSFDVVLKISNPNQKAVSLDQLDYIILLENNEIARGNLNEKLIVEAKNYNLLSIKVKVNVFNVLTKTTIENIFTLYKNIIGKNTQNTSLLSIKLKPTINQYVFPSYITIKKEL